VVFFRGVQGREHPVHDAHSVDLEEAIPRRYHTGMTPPVERWTYLAPNPKSAYKQLFVKGTRIPARTLYGLAVSAEEGAPLTPEEIAREYGLPIEAVREAIAYCESNPPELASDYAAEEALMEATGMNEPGYKYHPSPRLLSAQEMGRLRAL
jgi:uncharacterized protein (DUF433 family)